MKLSTVSLLATLAASLWIPALGAEAPEWPHAKAITWIVGFPPGGTMDTQARMVAQLLSRKTGQPVVVQNRVGAAGALALRATASAPADGYTVMTVTGPGIEAQDVPRLGHGLKPVALLSNGPMVLVASLANAPPANLQALLTEMRSRPEAWSYASSGVGTPQHLAGELLNKLAGTTMLHVPYKGGSQAVGDVVGGQVSLGMLGVMPLLSYIRTGKVRVYAVTSAARLPGVLPDVPTMQEAGVRGYDISQWYVLAVPEGVPPACVAQLNRWLNDIMVSEEMKEPLRAIGSLPGTGSPASVASFVRAEDEKWRAFARRAGIQATN